MPAPEETSRPLGNDLAPQTEVWQEEVLTETGCLSVTSETSQAGNGTTTDQFDPLHHEGIGQGTSTATAIAARDHSPGTTVDQGRHHTVVATEPQAQERQMMNLLCRYHAELLEMYLTFRYWFLRKLPNNSSPMSSKASVRKHCALRQYGSTHGSLW